MNGEIPKNHPRYHSLMLREKLSEGLKKGLVHETGMIAHGRGEAFDYLIGEETVDMADQSARAAAACLIIADSPVISVNGNVGALAAKECVSLADFISAKLEVNLFHRTDERVDRLIDELMKNGAEKVYGSKVDVKIDGLEHDRSLCDHDGIFSADVVLVALEDGDRCKALKNMDKKIVAIDLNPLSRTAKIADITIVDNVVRAIPNIEKWIKKLRDKNKEDLREIVTAWNNDKMLKEMLSYISKRLNSLY